jgi:hypothetical protein
VASLQVCFPIFVGETIPPLLDSLRSRSSVNSRDERLYEPDLKLNGRPSVEIDGFNLADVCPHGPVNPRASDAQKHAAGETVLAGSCSW